MNDQGDEWTQELSRFLRAVKKRFGSFPRRIVIDVYDAEIIPFLPLCMPEEPQKPPAKDRGGADKGR